MINKKIVKKVQIFWKNLRLSHNFFKHKSLGNFIFAQTNENIFFFI